MSEEGAAPGGRLGAVLAIAAGVLLLDQLTKAWAVDALATRDVDLVGSLRFHLVFNSGASFSVGEGRGLGPFLAIVAAGVAVGLAWYGRRTTSWTVTVAIGLLLGGALGNLADRAFRAGDGFLGGHVVDFVDLQFWPVFNVADAGITLGGLLLVWHLLRSPAEVDEGDGAAADDDGEGGKGEDDDGGAGEKGEGEQVEGGKGEREQGEGADTGDAAPGARPDRA